MTADEDFIYFIERERERERDWSVTIAHSIIE